MDTKQYIRYMEEMIATPGWTILVEESEKEIYHIQADALEANSWEAIQQMRGRAEALNELITLEAMIASQRAESEVEDVIDADI